MSLSLSSVLQKPVLQPSVPAGGIQLRRPQPAGRAPHRKQPCELYCRRSFPWPLQPTDAVSSIQKSDLSTCCSVNDYGEYDIVPGTGFKMLLAYLHNCCLYLTILGGFIKIKLKTIKPQPAINMFSFLLARGKQKLNVDFFETVTTALPK